MFACSCRIIYFVMIHLRNAWLPFLMAIIVISCNEPSRIATDPLGSWNDGLAKQSIIEFIESVTDSNDESYIPESSRIAVFDNDGTLWSEKPYYFQLQFAIDRIKELASGHPEWYEIQPFKAVLEGDMKTVMDYGVPGIIELVMKSHAGMSDKEFRVVVNDWIDTARHNETGKLYRDMVYRPMIELLNYFRDQGFKTYIVSGGGTDFLRAWSEVVYGIPPQQIIGSTIKKKFDSIEGEPLIVRMPEIEFINDKEAKPLGIQRHIGRMPVAAFGNSDGDLQMLQWTASGPGKKLMVYIHHTDADREWAYDRDSHVGKLDKGLDEARDKGWLIVDMKNDWKVVH